MLTYLKKIFVKPNSISFKKVNSIKQKTYFLNKLKYKLWSSTKAKIITNGDTSLGVLHENYIINELSFQSQNLIRKKINFNKVYQKRFFNFGFLKLRGKSLCLLQDISTKRNYAHFIFDLVSRLILIDRNRKISDYKNILVPSYKKKYEKNIFKFFKIKESQIIDCSNLKKIYCEEIDIPEHLFWKINFNWFKNLEKINPVIIKNIRNKFLTKNNKGKSYKNIFLDRSDSPNKWHQILNYNETISLLKKYNFKILKLNNMEFKKQVKIFSKAKNIIGVHGAGFTNLIFCQKNTKVLELRSSKRNFKIFKSVSKINNLKYRCWVYKSKKNDNIEINQKKLDNYLKKLN